MKYLNFSKMVSLGILSLSLAVAPLTFSASAQDTAPDGTTVITEEDNDSQWGWLGLLGLIGLAGLAGNKRHDEPTQYRDPGVTAETEYRR